MKLKQQTKAITYKSDDDDKSLKQKETCNRLFDERLNETQEISKEIDYNNLIYFKTKGSGQIDFIKFKGPFGLFREIRDGDISLTNAEKDQENFKNIFRSNNIRKSQT